MRQGFAALGIAGAQALAMSLAFVGGSAVAGPVPPAAPASAAPIRVMESAAAASVLANYPPAARAAGVEGQALIRCTHNEHLALKGCVLISETPAGQGFGAAALAMAAQSPDNPKLSFPDEPARPPEDLTITFTPRPPAISPDVTRMAHTITKASIINQPTRAQIQAAYPERALADQIEGGAAIDCVVTAAGKLVGCQLAAESPTGFGFGQATLDLAGDFLMKPRYLDGEAVDGANVRVGVSFTAADPTAPLSLDAKPRP
jgi:TonB family protein